MNKPFRFFLPQGIKIDTSESPIDKVPPKLTGFNRILAALTIIEASAQELERQFLRMKQQERRLKTMGAIKARPVLKEGKYLSLVFPDTSGRKKKIKYIGNDELAMAEAYASMERGVELEAVQMAIQDIQNKILQSQRQLSIVMKTLRLTR